MCTLETASEQGRGLWPTAPSQYAHWSAVGAAAGGRASVEPGCTKVCRRLKETTSLGTLRRERAQPLLFRSLYHALESDGDY